MKFGLHGLHRAAGTDPAILSQLAVRAEDVGFDSIWVGDHVALPVTNGASSANSALEPRLEVLSTLSFLAAVTSQVRLAAGVVVVPQRQPVLLAKQLTTIDVLSEGRLIVGIGVGHIESELTAFGVSLMDRGARTDEYVAAMQALWSEPTPNVSGRFISFSDVVERPLPVQRPHPPIVVGGHSAQALRRAARIGAGWYGWDLDIAETKRALCALDEALKQETRSADLGELEITITPSGVLDVETARRYADLGVHRLVLVPRAATGSGTDELITSFAETMIGNV